MAEKLSIASTVTLNNGVKMPILGFGVWQLKGLETEQAVLWALEAGYRHIDTASLYGNEREVGNAVRKSGIPRNEIFVTTKLWPTNFLRAESAFGESLARLGLEYVDLYLIHFPMIGKNRAWKILEKIYEKGLVKAIGVSNYSIEQCEEVRADAKVPPAVNQVEFNPFEYRKDLLAYCKEKGITFEAYSPLNRANQLDHPILREVAQQYSKTPAQIMLRWSLQHGAIVIPKSSHRERIIENAQIFDFEISEADMMKLDSLSNS